MENALIKLFTKLTISLDGIRTGGGVGGTLMRFAHQACLCGDAGGGEDGLGTGVLLEAVGGAVAEVEAEVEVEVEVGVEAAEEAEAVGVEAEAVVEEAEVQ